MAVGIRTFRETTAYLDAVYVLDEHGVKWSLPCSLADTADREDGRIFLRCINRASSTFELNWLTHPRSMMGQLGVGYRSSLTEAEVAGVLGALVGDKVRDEAIAQAKAVPEKSWIVIEA